MAPRALPPSKLKARRRKRRILALFMVLFSLLILIGVAVGLAWLPFFRIHTVDIVGASSVSEADIQHVATRDLAGTYYLVLPKNNVLLYPKELIQKDLLAMFPVFESVDVHSNNLQTLSISVVERETRALWCGDSVASSSPCYLLDASGVAYAPAADFSGQLYVKYYGTTSTTSAKQYLTPDQFRALAAFVEALAQTIPGDAPASVEVEGKGASARLASGFTLMFSLNDNGADVLDRLTIALKSDPFTSHQLSDFEYLDLRFGDKLYYKLK